MTTRMQRLESMLAQGDDITPDWSRAKGAKIRWKRYQCRDCSAVYFYKTAKCPACESTKLEAVV